MDSSLELFAHVEPDQWQGLMDLSCWRSGGIDANRFSGWLQATTTASPEVATRLLKSVDEEFLVSILQSIATIEEKDLDKDFVPDNLEILPSPDGEFFILLPQGHPMAPYVIQSLRMIFAENLLRGRRLLRACRTEINSQVTEQAFKFREARMADLGFLERDAAVEIFQPIPSTISGNVFKMKRMKKAPLPIAPFTKGWLEWCSTEIRSTSFCTGCFKPSRQVLPKSHWRSILPI